MAPKGNASADFFCQQIRRERFSTGETGYCVEIVSRSVASGAIGSWIGTPGEWPANPLPVAVVLTATPIHGSGPRQRHRVGASAAGQTFVKAQTGSLFPPWTSAIELMRSQYFSSPFLAPNSGRDFDAGPT
jgi:hypothetical protein